MIPVQFPEQTIVIAKDQPQYLPMPAHREPLDESGRLTFCWKLSWRERIKVLLTGKIWHQTLTFNGPLQPQKLLADKPFMYPESVFSPAKAEQ